MSNFELWWKQRTGSKDPYACAYAAWNAGYQAAKGEPTQECEHTWIPSGVAHLSLCKNCGMAKDSVYHYGVAIATRYRQEREQANAEIRKALDDMPVAPTQKPDAIGCKCSMCGEWQRWTPSGMVCKNGHGGAEGINQYLYTHPSDAAAQIDHLERTRDAQDVLLTERLGQIAKLEARIKELEDAAEDAAQERKFYD